MTSSDQEDRGRLGLAALFEELRRRRVIRTALYYVTGSVATVEGAGAFAEPLGLPPEAVRALAVLAISGLPVAIALSWTYDISAGDAPEAKALGRSGRMFLVAGMSALSVLAAVLLWTKESGTTGEIPIAARLTANGIAVLPFETPGQSEEIRALAQHLHARLIDGLNAAVAAPGAAEADRVRIISRAGVLPFAGGRVTVDSIQRALGVGMIVEGTLEAGRDSVRSRLRLIDAHTAGLLDTRAVNAALDEPIQLADSLGSQAVMMLRERLGDILRARSRQVGTGSVEAFRHIVWADEMLEAFHRAIERRDLAGARRSLEGADSLYEEARRLDPSWVEPLVLRGRLADEWAQFLASGDEGASYEAIYRRGLAFGEEAVRLTPTDREALYLRGRMSALLAGQVEASDEAERLRIRAEADLRAAILGNPTPARPLRTLSEVLAAQGRYREALDLGERAYAEDPYLESTRETLLRMFQYSLRLGRDADATRHCAEGRERFSDDDAIFQDCRLVLMAWSDIVSPDPDLAWLTVERELQAYPAALRPSLEPRLHAHVAAVLAAAGHADSARVVLQNARAADSGTTGVSLASAGTWALLGDADTAIEEVRGLLARQPDRAGGLATAPELRPLRADQRFHELLDSLALLGSP